MEGDGTKIQKLEELANGKGYILVANNDPLIRIRYNTKAIQMAPSHGLGGITMKNEHMSRIRKVTERWSIKQQPKSFTEQPSFTESVKNEPLTQEPNIGRATPKQQKPKTASKTPRQRSAVSESIQNADEEDFPDNHDEIYGGKEVQYLSSKKSNPQSPRAPGITLKSDADSPKSNNRSSAATPNMNRKSAVSSPKVPSRSAGVSPKSVARSAVTSPKSILRSSEESANALSRTSTASDGKSLSPSEIGEESRPQSEVKTSKNAISRKESKEVLKSGKGSTEVLSNKGSEGNLLKAGGKEKLVSAKVSQDING